MDRNKVVGFHRRRPEQSGDRAIVEGPLFDIIRQYENLAPSVRSQYSIMDGSMEYNHLEIAQLARELKDE
jgi:hypothetical protein